MRYARLAPPSNLWFCGERLPFGKVRKPRCVELVNSVDRLTYSIEHQIMRPPTFPPALAERAKSVLLPLINASQTVEGVTPALPLRRWLASVTDVLILFVAHLLVVAPVVYLALDPFDITRLLVRLSSVACWAYLWWGWTRGQTPGQRAWKLRVVSRDGEPMTPGRALQRLLGYAFVCLTLKIGLLPILFDPLRRGWHDRFAGTLVLDARVPMPEPGAFRRALAACYGREALARRARPLPLVPDFAFARRGWPLVFAAYLALSVALTWPVARTWHSALAGDGGDSLVFLWNNWYFSHALATGAPLLHTDLLFYPFQTPLLFHTMNWFDCVLAWPLLHFFSPLEVYNLLFLLTPAWCALSSYWLACSLSKARWASFLVAPVFGFSPYFMTHGLGHANLTSAQMMPIFAGLFYAALVGGRARYAVGAGVALALAGLCDWQYLLFCGLIAVGLWTGVEWSLHRANRRFEWRRLGLATGALCCGLLLLSPLLVPLLRENQNATYMDKSKQAGGFGATFSSWTAPGKLHPILDPQKTLSVSNETNLTPGWCILILCAVGLLCRRRRLLPWLAVAAVAGVLAFGPTLTFRQSTFVLSLGLGAPGNAFNPPWNMEPMFTTTSQFALDFALDKPSFIGEMPFSWLAPHLPMLKAFRVPARLGVIVLMCCAPLAALGLAWLFERAQRRWLAALLGFGVASAIGFEYLAAPFPTKELRVPAFYRQIARDPARYAIVDVPLTTSSQFMGWQTVHGKPTLVGVTARVPPEAFDLVARNLVLRALSVEVYTTPRHQNNTAPALDFDSQPSLKELRQLKVRYIVLHKSQSDNFGYVRTEAVLTRLRLPVVFDDDDTRVYDLRAPQAQHKSPAS